MESVCAYAILPVMRTNSGAEVTESCGIKLISSPAKYSGVGKLICSLERAFISHSGESLRALHRQAQESNQRNHRDLFQLWGPCKRSSDTSNTSRPLLHFGFLFRSPKLPCQWHHVPA